MVDDSENDSENDGHSFKIDVGYLQYMELLFGFSDG